MKKPLLIAAIAAIAASSAMADAPLKQSLVTPSSTEVYRNQTFVGPEGNLGMGYVVWKIGYGDVNVDRSSTGHVSLYYNDVLIRQLDASNDLYINFNGVATALDGDDPYEPPTSQVVAFYFVTSNTPEQQFLNPGTYKMVVDDGVFRRGNAEDGYTPLEGATVTYEYHNSVYVDWTYTLTPSSGSNVENLQTIELTFPNARSVGYSNKAGFILTNPNGEEVHGASTYPAQRNGNQIVCTYKDSAKVTVDWIQGTWTFTINPNVVTVDSQPFEGLTAVYTIGTHVGVEILGLEKAETYTVVSLDGKLLVNNGPASSLLSLTRGMYVINGKKVMVK